MRLQTRSFLISLICATAVAMLWSAAWAQPGAFRNAPSSASAMKNPYAGNGGAANAGKKLYTQNCAQCHGKNLEGMGPAPALDSAAVRKANPGELFWFITKGNPASGMPAWNGMPKNQRWEIVSFLQSEHNEKSAAVIRPR